MPRLDGRVSAKPTSTRRIAGVLEGASSSLAVEPELKRSGDRFAINVVTDIREAQPMSAPSSSEHEIESGVVQEGVTMALYVSLSLLAVLVATQTITYETKDEVARTVFLTACGLLIAHLLAFGVSSRLVSGGKMGGEGRRAVAAQISAGLIVALVATLPTLLLDPEISLRVAEFALLGFVCVVGYLAARQSGGTRLRALAYTALVLCAALVVLVVKGLVDH